MALGAAVSGMGAGTGLFQSILAIWPPVAHRYQKVANMADPQLLPTVGDLVEMRFRKLLAESSFLNYCKEQGFSEVWSTAYFNASYRLMDGYDYIKLWRRQEITRDTLDDRMEQLHFSPDTVAHLIKATEYYPSPPDLIRFAVREVYSPDIADRFGLFQDIPQDFLKEAEKVGLQEQFAINYWGAHWELPSANQGFEMLHRHIIDKDVLRQLLRALDVMPYWRDKLIDLSYNPITRVDIRRMYRTGQFTTDDELNTRYEAVGYSPEDAQLLTAFTKAYEGDEYSGITRANLVTAFKKGLLTKGELADMLRSIGLSETAVAFWSDMADYEKSVDLLDTETADLVTQYQQGKKTIDDVRNELNEKDLPASYINEVINTATTQEAKTTRLPTKADLLDWMGKKIITESVFFSRMKSVGYRDEDIMYYMTEYSLDHDTTKRKYLNIKTYLRWWLNGYISEELLRSNARDTGISDEDLELLMMETQE